MSLPEGTLETKSELTVGQQLVGIKFNPSNLSEVDQVKQTFADLIDKIYDLPEEKKFSGLFKDIAIKSLVAAQMSCIKIITW